MTNLDSIYRNIIGFDRLASSLDNRSNGYPPYNLIKDGDYDYTLEMAVAGFGPDDISVETKNGTLTVSGSVYAENSDNYIYRGIAKRDFKRSWTLMENAKVGSAEIHNGMLKVDIHVEVPEEQKPKRIPVRVGNVLTHHKD